MNVEFALTELHITADKREILIEAYRGFIQYAPPQYAPYIERTRQKIRELER